MTGSNVTGALALDIVLLLVLAGYAIGMYRTGLVAGALALIGLLGGGLLALWLLPGLLDQWPLVQGRPALRTVALVIGTLVAASIGQHLGGMVGGHLRSWVTFRPARALDSLLGAVAGVVVAGALLWFVAGALLPALPSGAAQAVTGSRVVQGIDRAMPESADRVLARTRQTLDENGFPRVFSGLRPEPIRPVDPPDPGITQGRGIEVAADSVVKVTGTAPECGRRQFGSGWVAAPERVVTNAHVIAGVDNPTVQVGGTGPTLRATPVAFDPRRDLAVLAVPGLSAEPLPMGGRLSHGDEVVAAGFPGGGSYDLDAGRVRDVVHARGESIYGEPGVDRQVYAVSTELEPGNSGGPLLSPTGQVVGTVFAASLSDPGTGYALTAFETRSLITRASGATEAVSTRECTTAQAGG